MHGGPIVALLGAVDNVGGFIIGLAAGILVDAALILLLVGITAKKGAAASEATPTEGASDSDALLLPDTVALETTRGTNREDIIRELVASIAATGRASDAEALVDAALAREEQHSTGVGNGVAIPHAHTAGVTRPTLAFARLPKPGIQWAEGEEATDLVFLIAVPEGSGNQHLKILSKLARRLMKEDFRAQLRAAGTREEVIDLVGDAVAVPTPAQ